MPTIWNDSTEDKMPRKLTTKSVEIWFIFDQVIEDENKWIWNNDKVLIIEDEEQRKTILIDKENPTSDFYSFFFCFVILLDFDFLEKFTSHRSRDNTTKKIYLFYRVCHGLRVTKWNDYFRANFDHFWIKHCFLRKLRQKWKLIQALNQTTISKFCLPEYVKCSVQIFPI